ncbi:DUF6098 family protein [Georgenia alba]|uniref:DUF6098 family protein n=1 Tax=Georgenia alba TaxID=2233858 RepID=A0ABW2Q7V1_9MICO
MDEDTGRAAREVAAAHDLPILTSVGEVVELQRAVGGLYVRYSLGPQDDPAEGSVDKESGCRLPGVSTNPVTPEPWWDRPAEHWVARQLVQYDHLSERPGIVGWLLAGTEVGRGPDCEPLLADITPLAVISPELQHAAEELYRTAFDPGRH